MNYSLDYYRTFYEIVRNNSFSQAAKVLYVSQSSVSQTLSKLEDCIGDKLIDRTTKQLSLTESGKILYQALDKAFISISSAEERVGNRVAREEGQIRIGISDSLCRYVFMRYLEKFKRLHPNIHLMIVNEPSNQSIAQLHRAQIDVAIVNLMHGAHYEGLQVEKLMAFQDVLIWAAPSATVDFDPLRLAKPFISLGRGATTRLQSERLFNKLGKKFLPDMELSNLDLVIDFVRSGFGISLVPDYAIDDAGGLTIEALPYDFLKREIGIVTPKNKSRSPALLALFDIVAARRLQDV